MIRPSNWETGGCYFQKDNVGKLNHRLPAHRRLGAPRGIQLLLADQRRPRPHAV